MMCTLETVALSPLWSSSDRMKCVTPNFLVPALNMVRAVLRRCTPAEFEEIDAKSLEAEAKRLQQEAQRLGREAEKTAKRQAKLAEEEARRQQKAADQEAKKLQREEAAAQKSLHAACTRSLPALASARKGAQVP